VFKLKKFKLSSAQKNNKHHETRNKMKTIPHSLLLALASISLCGTPPLRAADIDPKIAEIAKTAEAFVEAFHKGDAGAHYGGCYGSGFAAGAVTGAAVTGAAAATTAAYYNQYPTGVYYRPVY